MSAVSTWEVQSSVADATDIFDPSEALGRACDDLELLTELAELFAGHRDVLLSELTAAVTAGDAALIAEHGHSIKGSIGTFTTRRPYDLARELEFAGKSENIADAARILAELKQSLTALELEVNRFLASVQ